MRRFAALLLPLAVFALPASALAGETKPEWSQERVSALVQELVEHVEAIRTDLASRPSVPEQAEARGAVTNDVVRLDQRARELAQRLASGAGRAETAGLVREIETLVGQVATDSREYPAHFDMHVHIERVQRITGQLARYYEEP